MSTPRKSNTHDSQLEERLALRRKIEEEILGTVQWRDPITGFVRCPGAELLTSASTNDVQVKIDGAPTIHCFHANCRDVVAEANFTLRSRVGTAEIPVAFREATAVLVFVIVRVICVADIDVPVEPAPVVVVFPRGDAFFNAGDCRPVIPTGSRGRKRTNPCSGSFRTPRWQSEPAIRLLLSGVSDGFLREPGAPALGARGGCPIGNAIRREGRETAGLDSGCSWGPTAGLWQTHGCRRLRLSPSYYCCAKASVTQGGYSISCLVDPRPEEKMRPWKSAYRLRNTLEHMPARMHVGNRYDSQHDTGRVATSSGV